MKHRLLLTIALAGIACLMAAPAIVRADPPGYRPLNPNDVYSSPNYAIAFMNGDAVAENPLGGCDNLAQMIDFYCWQHEAYEQQAQIDPVWGASAEGYQDRVDAATWCWAYQDAYAANCP